MADTEKFEVWIPNDTAEGHEVQERIAGLLERHGWPMRDVFGVRLALEEAMVNAIKHGNRMDPTKQIYIACQLCDGEVCVTIEDQGEGFQIADIPDPTDEDNLDKPGGRGIMLIRSFMSVVEYNDRGNRLHMRKRLSANDE